MWGRRHLSLRRQEASPAAAHGTAAAWLTELTTRCQRGAYGRIRRIHLPEGAVLTQRDNAQSRNEAMAPQEPATK